MRNFVENPRVSCSLSGGLGTLGAIYRAIPILHAGPGCGIQASIGTQIDYLGGGTGCPSTNTYEKEVIFGGEQRLRETIQGTLDVIDADVYVVLSGCTAGIIGDDIQSVVEEFQDSGHTVLAIETAGFKGDTYYGYSVTMLALFKHLAQKTVTEEKTVNLFGLVPNLDITSNGDFEELVRVLGRIGVNANTFFYIPDGVEQFRHAGNAALNINLSPWLLSNVEALLQSSFGIQTLHYPGLPVGPTATSDFLRKVGETLGIDKALVERVIREEEDYVYRYYEHALRELYRYIIVGDVNTVLGYSRYLTNDVGQVAYAAIITDQLPQSKRAAVEEELSHLEYGKPPKIFYENDKFKISEIIREHEDFINLILGSSYEKEIASELDTFHVTLSYPCTDQHILNKSHIGYRGCLTLIEDMYNNL
ncbi:MAG: nifK1 [Oscillospiraceae bacterium]|nr:nifK1 [Oscillospiraceae bacterium]